MNKGLVSIIIPYYRKKKYFKKTFYSAINQSYKNIEIIIIYDDSSKKELEYIKQITAPRKNVKILVNKKNIGAGFSRNKGIKKSKGEFIAFLDADDIWKKHKLKKQIRFMNVKKIDASFTAYEILEKIDYKNLTFSCDIGLSTVVIRKKKLIESNCSFPPLKTKEDYVLWLKLSKKGVNFYGIQEFLSFWKKSSNSLSSNLAQKLIDGFRVYFVYLKLGLLKSLFYLFMLSINFLLK